MAEDCSSVHMIDGDANFNVEGFENFLRSVKLSNRNDLSYCTVAIMGPQSSGKSTLLNHLFSTNFVTMNAAEGSNQTTLGIWAGLAHSIDEPLTVILDIEGNDGQERGQNQGFEKKTAVYALALADVVLINMKYSDIGRESGGNKPLLRTVFQATMKLFSARKTTLLFVIRDKHRDTPLPILENKVQNFIQQMWEDVCRSLKLDNPPIQDYFIVKVVALSSYYSEVEQFGIDVGQLREQFKNSIAPGGLAADKQGRVPGSAFSMSAQQIWQTIKLEKSLDLPSHKVLVATVKCEEIAKECFALFRADEDWVALEVSATSGDASNFGNKLSSILNNYLSMYEKEAMYYDENVKDARRLKLEAEMLELVHPTYSSLLGRYDSEAKHAFETELESLLSTGAGFAAALLHCSDSCMIQFDNHCQDIAVDQAIHWESTSVRENLTHHIDTYASSLRQNKLSQIFASSQEKISKTLEDARIEAILIGGYGGGSWESIRLIFEHVTEIVATEFRAMVSGFDLEDSVIEEMLPRIRMYARNLVENKAREEARKVVLHMKDRFIHLLDVDRDSRHRQWNSSDDLDKIVEDARSEALKILSVMTVIRLEERPDNIQDVLFYCLMNQSTDESFTDGGGVSGDPLAHRAWDGVSEADTIITPIECMSLWKAFLDQTGSKIYQVTIIQNANKGKEESVKREKEAETKAKEAEDRAEERLKEAEEREKERGKERAREAELRVKEAEARAEERAKEAETKAKEAENRLKEAEERAKERGKERAREAELRLKEAEARAQERAKEAERSAIEAEEKARRDHDPANVIAGAIASVITLPFKLFSSR